MDALQAQQPADVAILPRLVHHARRLHVHLRRHHHQHVANQQSLQDVGEDSEALGDRLGVAAVLLATHLPRAEELHAREGRTDALRQPRPSLVFPFEHRCVPLPLVEGIQVDATIKQILIVELWTMS